jgi:hypothetical protein
MALRLLIAVLAGQGLLSSAAVVHANLRAESTQRSEILSFSSHFWNNTMTRFAQHEIEMTKGDSPKVDKVLYVIFSMLLGCCGIDRCFMGQIALGCLKGFTFGGLLVWAVIDYWVCVYCALAKMEEIDMVGYQATFKKGTIDHAFWACVFILIFNLVGQYRQYQMQKAQMEQQQALFKMMAEPEEFSVPVRHQSLAHIPTPMTKMLRQAGIVGQDPTIPELIAAFQTMDKDGDGQIDAEELKEALSKMGVSDEDISTMIKEADTDGDGKISKDEFLKYNAKKTAA